MLLHVDLVSTRRQDVFHLLLAPDLRLSMLFPNAFLNTVELLLLVFFVLHVGGHAHRVELVVVVLVDLDIQLVFLPLLLDTLEIIILLVHVLLTLRLQFDPVGAVGGSAVI